MGRCDLDEIPAERRLGLAQGPFHVSEERLGARRRGARDEARAGVDQLAVGARQEMERETSACEKSHAQQQQSDRDAQGRPRVVDTVADDGSEPAFTKLLEARIDALSQGAHGAPVDVLEGLAQVPRQHQEALDQRRRDHAHDDQRNIEQHVADDAAHQHQRQKGRDGGQRRGDHRCQHAPCAALGRLERRLARLIVGERILTDDDGVVDDDAQRHDEAEQAHHVDAATDQIEHAEGRHERDGDAHRDPEGDAAVQEQKQNEHHQHQAAGAVFQHELNALLDEQPGLVVDDRLHPRWPAAAAVLEPALEDLGRLETARVLVAPEAHLDGRLAVDTDRRLAAACAALDGGDVSEAHQAA